MSRRLLGQFFDALLQSVELNSVALRLSSSAKAPAGLSGIIAFVYLLVG